ncbi:hypothetical protein I4U23_016361 [Adineta vaga]|nr:hypothetical protein I4U23_016361 [Adineta vaga]
MDDSHSTEKFHCIYDGSDIHLINNEFTEMECYNGGQLQKFSKLISANIKPHEVLKWGSSIEKADDYAT